MLEYCFDISFSVFCVWGIYWCINKNVHKIYEQNKVLRSRVLELKYRKLVKIVDRRNKNFKVSPIFKQKFDCFLKVLDFCN